MHGKLVSCRIDSVDMNHITQTKNSVHENYYMLRLVSMQLQKLTCASSINTYVHVSGIMLLIVGLRQYRGISHGAMVPGICVHLDGHP